MVGLCGTYHFTNNTQISITHITINGYTTDTDIGKIIKYKQIKIKIWDNSFSKHKNSGLKKNLLIKHL